MNVEEFEKHLASFRHCDTYIRDKLQPMPLRKFLFFKRLPAYLQYEESTKRRLRIDKDPVLFATMAKDVEAYNDGRCHALKAVTRVRVVMASRMGDLGVTEDLKAVNGYSHRFHVEYLTDFSETP